MRFWCFTINLISLEILLKCLILHIVFYEKTISNNSNNAFVGTIT